MMKRMTRKALAAMMVTAMIFCSSLGLIDTEQIVLTSFAKKITMSGPSSVTAKKTGKIKLKNNNKKVTWSTSNKKVLKITKKTKTYATVQGVKAGTAKITAKVGKAKMTLKIKVKAQAATVAGTSTTTSKDLTSVASGVTWSTSAADTCLSKLNAARKAAGMGTLSVDSKMLKAAQIRVSEAQYQSGSFSSWAHYRPSGAKWSTVFAAVGYTSGGFGENAGLGYGNGNDLYTAWYNSATHKANMFNKAFTKIGLAVGKVKVNGTYQWVAYMELKK